MGYDIHIHRREFWADVGNDISVEEWRALIAADPTLEEDGVIDWATADGEASQRTPTARLLDHEGERHFMLQRGEIKAKNPSPLLVAKACEIAARLGGKVQGDDGEIYRPDGSYDPVHIGTPRRPFWSKLFTTDH